MLKKLLFVHHILSLPDTAVAKEVDLVQKEKGYPGLASEADAFLQRLDIPLDPTCFSKAGWKKEILARIHRKNKEELLSQIRSYKKLDVEKLSAEEYGAKGYLSSMKVSEARTFFSARSSMLSTVQYNFKNNNAYKANEYKCKCGELDTQTNLLTCRLYSHLREDLNISHSDTDLVRYYQGVIRERLSC